MTAPIKPIAALDVPVEELAAQVDACRLLADAAAHTESPSDRLAYALDQRLITHPEVHLADDADYPAWAAQLRTLPTYRSAKEAS